MDPLLLPLPPPLPLLSSLTSFSFLISLISFWEKSFFFSVEVPNPTSPLHPNVCAFCRVLLDLCFLCHCRQSHQMQHHLLLYPCLHPYSQQLLPFYHHLCCHRLSSLRPLHLSFDPRSIASKPPRIPYIARSFCILPLLSSIQLATQPICQHIASYLPHSAPS